MGQRGRKHILIVEDSPDLHELLSELFETEGYAISHAYDGRQALERLRALGDQELPSLILLDIMMPVMDGIEFRAEQRRDPRLRDIPVVVMTADSSVNAREAGLGVADFFRKPITDVGRLLASVERCALQ